MNKSEKIKNALLRFDTLPINDPELAHTIADDILCDLLIALGGKEVVDKFHEVTKYYA